MLISSCCIQSGKSYEINELFIICQIRITYSQTYFCYILKSIYTPLLTRENSIAPEGTCTQQFAMYHVMKTKKMHAVSHNITHWGQRLTVVSAVFYLLSTIEQVNSHLHLNSTIKNIHTVEQGFITLHFKRSMEFHLHKQVFSNLISCTMNT